MDYGGLIWGIVQGTILGVIEGDIRSLDYSSHGFFCWYVDLDFLKLNFLGVPIIRIIVYSGPLNFGNLPFIDRCLLPVTSCSDTCSGKHVRLSI